MSIEDLKFALETAERLDVIVSKFEFPDVMDCKEKRRQLQEGAAFLRSEFELSLREREEALEYLKQNFEEAQLELKNGVASALA